MKIKIFRCEDMEMNLEKLENEINEFIENKKIIDIKFKEYTCYDEDLISKKMCVDIFGSVLVLYEEINNEK